MALALSQAARWLPVSRRYDTERFANGEQALASLIANPPDLVLLDLMLPGLDGLSLCRELRHKLRCLSGDVKYVHSVYGIGYQFELPVREGRAAG